MPRPKLGRKEFIALVETLKYSEEVKPSQEIKRRIFQKYNVGEEKDPTLTIVFYDIMRSIGILDKIIVKALKIPNIYILDPWLRAALRAATYFIHTPRYPLRRNEREILKKSIAKFLSQTTHPYTGVYYWDAVEKLIPEAKYEIKDKLDELEYKYKMPKWIITKIKNILSWEETEQLLREFNKPTLISIRVNTLKASVEEVAAQLKIEGKKPIIGRYVPTVIKFKGPYNFSKSKLYQEGKIIPQDEACAYATLILNPKPGEKVVDMCAAPGGKTTHMAELMRNEGVIYALDIDENRIKVLKQNIERMGIKNVKIMKIDCRKAPQILGENIADKVLLDPPCTSSGTLAKYPEVRWRLTEKKIQELAEYQYQMLKSAVKLARRGGLILYTVCSIFPEECEDNIKRLLREYKGKIELVKLKSKLSQGLIPGTLRAWPHKHKITGFFYALLRKIED